MDNSKKKLIIIISIAAAVLIALAVILAVALNRKGEDSYRSVRIQTMEGTVQILRGDKTLDAYESMNLKNEDQILTSKDSECVLKLDEDKFVYIGENSKIYLETSEKNADRTKLTVSEGSILTEVQNKLGENQTFDVETPNSTMAIRGTVFKTDVRVENGVCQISYALFRGEIELSVVEKTADGSYQVGTFKVQPLQQVVMEVEEKDLVTVDELKGVIEKIGAEDPSVSQKSFDTFESFQQSSEKIGISEIKLSDKDVKEVTDFFEKIESGLNVRESDSAKEPVSTETESAESSDRETETEIENGKETEKPVDSETETEKVTETEKPVETETEKDTASESGQYHVRLITSEGKTEDLGQVNELSLQPSRKIKTKTEFFLGWYTKDTYEGGEEVWTCLSNEQEFLLIPKADIDVYEFILPLYSTSTELHIRGFDDHFLLIPRDGTVDLLDFDFEIHLASKTYHDPVLPLTSEYVRKNMRTEIYRVDNVGTGYPVRVLVDEIDSSQTNYYVINYILGGNYGVSCVLTAIVS